MRLTAIVLTRNEEDHITACIATLGFADHVLVVDSFSTDDTVQLAKDCGATVIQHPFQDYASQRNFALEHVASSADWVLFVDADERVTAELANEVRQKIQFPGYAGFRVPRHNYIFGKLTRGAGWFPDYQTRLLKVGYAHYDPNVKVHEVVVLNGKEGTCSHPFIHYNYKNFKQFQSKQRRYVRYDAQILLEKGIRPKSHSFITMPLRHFWYRFITLQGYADGLHGLRLSLLMAWYEFRKYRILSTLWQQADYRSNSGKA